jgi:hypothetical protein
MSKITTSHIIKGVIITTAIIIIGLVVEKTNAKPGSIAQRVPALLIISGVAISVIIFSRKTSTYAFGELFLHGFRTAAVVVCLMALYTFIVARWFTAPPTLAEIEAAKKELMQQQQLMPQEAEVKVKESIPNQWIFKVGITLFGTLISGALGAGTGALVCSHKNNSP